MTKKVLVTGGCGFIGSHLCEALLSRGWSVVVVDNLSTGTLDNIQSFKDNDRFTFIQADCNNDDLSVIFRHHHFDAVFHYAATVGVDRTKNNPLLVLDDLKGIRNILECARKNHVKKVIYASSSEVYGEPVELPEREEGITNAKLTYAVVKLAGERYLQAYYKKYGLNTTALRFFNVYGPRQISTAYGFVTGIFIDRVLRGLSPQIFGDGTQTRDFVFIDDNIKASLIALDSPQSAGQIINIGRGEPTTIEALGKIIIDLAGAQLDLEFVPERPLDIKHRNPCIDRMVALLGYKASTPLREGLLKTIEWYRKHLPNVAIQ